MEQQLVNEIKSLIKRRDSGENTQPQIDRLYDKLMSLDKVVERINKNEDELSNANSIAYSS